MGTSCNCCTLYTCARPTYSFIYRYGACTRVIYSRWCRGRVLCMGYLVLGSWCYCYTAVHIYRVVSLFISHWYCACTVLFLCCCFSPPPRCFFFVHGPCTGCWFVSVIIMCGM
ncbi:unnamed protein product [Pylaiella littoralis]